MSLKISGSLHSRRVLLTRPRYRFRLRAVKVHRLTLRAGPECQRGGNPGIERRRWIPAAGLLSLDSAADAHCRWFE